MKKRLILLIVLFISLGATCNKKVANEIPDFITLNVK